MFTFICNLMLVFNINVSCRVDAVKTPTSEADVKAALEQSYVDLYDRQPPKNVLNMALAHVALENGRGAKLVNNNLGNIGAARVATSGHQYYVLGPARFLAHPTVQKGAESYWKHMHTRCKIALKNFNVGNGQLSAENLRDCGYHRSDVTSYGKTMGSLFNEHLSKKDFVDMVHDLFNR